MRNVTDQGESGDCKDGFKAAVDEEGAEEAQAVVSEVLEWQLEDVSPADAAEIDLFGRAVGSAAQHKELGTRAVLFIPDDSEPRVYGSLFHYFYAIYI